MKAITIKQPWAHLICTPRQDNPQIGIKDIENRTWATKFRGKVLVHASACKKTDVSVSDELFHWIRKNRGQWAFGCMDSPKGAIIGSVEIVDCVINHHSIWAEKSKVISKPNKEDYYIGGNWVEYNMVNYNRDLKEWEENKPIHNWVLANPVLFAKPILNVKGKLSFWEYDLNICHICGQPAEFECKVCGEFHCDKCQASYNQFTQIDYDCCSDCADSRYK